MSLLDELNHRQETSDGSRPEAPHFNAELARKRPLSAFSMLSGGDAFEMVNGRPPPDGVIRAQAFVRSRVEVKAHGAPAAQQQRVAHDMSRLLSGNLELLARLEVAKPIVTELIPAGRTLASYGYPKSTSKTAIGLFWDDPKWDKARIALRQDKLEEVPQLTVHEMAHAVHYLAFTQDERDLIYRLLLRTFRTRSAVDEAFAIYSEREFVEEFTADDKRAPGVYGFTRQRWSEDHVFTRFVRNLYYPHKPLAGPKMAPTSGPRLFG